MSMYVNETEVQPCETPGWAGDTHVLAYLPPEVMDGGGWELQPRAVFEETSEGHVPGHFAPVVIDAPRDADPGGLAAAVADAVGYPVTLTPGTWEIRTHRFWGAWQTEPVYYVSPERA